VVRSQSIPVGFGKEGMSTLLVDKVVEEPSDLVVAEVEEATTGGHSLQQCDSPAARW
jgi:hypothetical protein